MSSVDGEMSPTLYHHQEFDDEQKYWSYEDVTSHEVPVMVAFMMYHDADLDNFVDGDVDDGLHDDKGYRGFPTSQGSSAHFF